MDTVIEIVNMRNRRMVQDENVIRVDRSSVLGNPFVMHTEEDRDHVCDQYESWFNLKINDIHSLHAKEARRILRTCKKYARVYLLCWCAPKRCHAETIKRWLEEHL